MEIIALFAIMMLTCQTSLLTSNSLKECATALARKQIMDCIRQSDMESEITHNFGNLYIILIDLSLPSSVGSDLIIVSA